MQTIVKKWFRDKDSGILDNGGGTDISVHKDDLVGCHFLKVGSNVEFECHISNQGLIAKKVTLSKQKNPKKQGFKSKKKSPFGVMV